MKTRQEIKRRAKDMFSEYYWPCVGTAFLAGMIIAALTTSVLFSGLAVIGFSVWGAQIYRGEKTSMKLDLTARKIGGYLWMGLFEFLWTCLFIIPGIIKSFSYAMTPFILGDCPNVPATEALKLSKRMMKGHKWQLFVFELSFLGWQILSLITFGIVGVFYSEPYMAVSMGGFYEELKASVIEEEKISASEFEGRF